MPERLNGIALPANERNIDMRNIDMKGRKVERVLSWRWYVYVALAATGLLLGQIAGAMTFAMDNQSDITILAVYAGPDYNEQWGDNLLGSDVLMPGHQRQFYLAAEAGHCIFDVRTISSNGVVRNFMGRDFCESAHVTLERDRRLVISNKSLAVIGLAQVSLATESSWGEDRLGEGVVVAPDDDHVVILGDRYGSHCTFDIRLVTLERTSAEYRGRDLCKDAIVVFHKEKKLTVVNTAEEDIYYVHVSRDHADQGWGRDMMGESILSQGEEVALRLHQFDEDQCQVDILLEETDDVQHVYEDVDICATERLVHPRGPRIGSWGVTEAPVIPREELAPGQTFRDCDDCPWMVLVNGGTFDRGSWEEDEETPVTNVTVPGPFAVGQFEVSVGQFEEFVNDTDHDSGSRCVVKQGSRWRLADGRSWRDPGFDQDDSHPVVCVNWDDATAYARWLTERTGLPYRLLTEAEAELLARASAINFEHSGRVNCRSCGSQWDGRGTSPVGRLRPDQLGLSGVFGNAAEWVQDCYQSGYSNAPRDGSAWLPQSCERRAVRGGCWSTRAQKLRASGRGYSKYDRRSSCVGFRVARNVGRQ